VIGILRVGRLAVVGYLLFLVGAAILAHARGVSHYASTHLRRVVWSRWHRCRHERDGVRSLKARR
jgi:hypothetical protein